MSDPFSSSPQNASAENRADPPQSSALEKGLAALKRKEYALAIAQLEAICDSADSDRRTLAKAQMALVTAYEQMGELRLAIALCQPLSDSRSRQVRAWAGQTLERLQRREAALIETPRSRSNPLTQAEPDASPGDRIPGVSSIPDLDSRENAPRSGIPTAAPTAATEPASPQRSPAGRARSWAPLPKSGLKGLVLLQLGTAIALIWVVQTVLNGLFRLLNLLLNRGYWLVDLRQYATVDRVPFWLVLLGAAVLLSAAPWLLDGLLKRWYGLKLLSLAELDRHSSEAVRLLRRTGSQQRRSVPTLGVLPTDAPLALTYGSLPQTARIVVSQGLLEQLSEDELAAIFAAELVHIQSGAFAVLTLVVLTAQIPFLAYWHIAQWGDRRSNPMLRGVLAAIAALSYGLYWLLHWTGRGLSRLRLYYSDRAACSVTGNPNGLARALLKVVRGMAADVQQQGSTNPLLESFDLLMPVGHRTALSLGTAFPDLADPRAYAWDLNSAARVWLSLHSAHPRLGDRFLRLGRAARHWGLEPELSLTPAPQRSSSALRLQAAPLISTAFGAIVALTLWIVGWVAEALEWYALDWLRGDRSLLWGCVLLGFSFGMFLRINAYFPDIRSANLTVNPPLADLLSDPAALPVHCQPVQLQGKLLGRRGLQNGLLQDLFLETPSGLMRLHYLSWLGTVGNLLLHSRHPEGLVGQRVMVTGWFRRNATPWIDVDTIQPQGGAAHRSGHQLWSTLLAIAAAIAGAYIIARDGL